MTFPNLSKLCLLNPAQWQTLLTQQHTKRCPQTICTLLLLRCQVKLQARDRRQPFATKTPSTSPAMIESHLIVSWLNASQSSLEEHAEAMCSIHLPPLSHPLPLHPHTFPICQPREQNLQPGQSQQRSLAQKGRMHLQAPITASLSTPLRSFPSPFPPPPKEKKRKRRKLSC